MSNDNHLQVLGVRAARLVVSVVEFQSQPRQKVLFHIPIDPGAYAAGAAVTLALVWLGASGHVGGEPLGAFRRSLYVLLRPAELIGESAGSFTSFLIAGFLGFFVIYVLGLLFWEWAHARKKV